MTKTDVIYDSRLQHVAEQRDKALIERDKLGWELRQLRATLKILEATLPPDEDLTDYGRGLQHAIRTAGLVKPPDFWPMSG